MDEPRVTGLSRSGATATVVALLALAAVGGWAAAGGGVVDVAWLPSWGARLAFELDGLGRPYALLATGIGVAVFGMPRPTCRGTWRTRVGRSPTGGASSRC